MFIAVTRTLKMVLNLKRTGRQGGSPLGRTDYFFSDRGGPRIIREKERTSE